MNFYKKLTTILFLILSACSPQNEQNTNFETKIEALATFQDTSTASADFGNPVTASTTRIFTFKNIGDTAGPGTATLTGTNAASFSIVLQTGCATVNVGLTCTVRVSFNPSGKAIGTYTADLNIGGTPLKTLQARVDVTGGSTSAGSGNIEASISGSVISNPLDYGSFSGTQSSTKIIRLTNKGTSSIGPHTAALSDGDFTFTLNSCSSKTLAPNAYCDVRVTFSASGKTAQEYLTDLTFAGNSFPLKATVTASSGTTTSGGGTPSIAILEGTNMASDPLNYGSFSGTQSLTKILTVKNTGTSSVVVNPTLGNTDFTFTLNSCLNKTLAPNGSCTVRVTFSASGKSSGAKTTTMVVHPTKSLALEATVTGGVTVTYQLEYSNYGTCSAANACDGAGSQTRTATCRQLNNGVPGNLVDNSNCPAPTLSQACNSPAGTKNITITGGTQTVSCLAGSSSQTFVSVSCNQNYSIQGESCISSLDPESFVQINTNTVNSQAGLFTHFQPEFGNAIGGQSLSLSNNDLVSFRVTINAPATIDVLTFKEAWNNIEIKNSSAQIVFSGSTTSILGISNSIQFSPSISVQPGDYFDIKFRSNGNGSFIGYNSLVNLNFSNLMVNNVLVSGIQSSHRPLVHFRQIIQRATVFVNSCNESLSGKTVKLNSITDAHFNLSNFILNDTVSNFTSFISINNASADFIDWNSANFDPTSFWSGTSFPAQKLYLRNNSTIDEAVNTENFDFMYQMEMNNINFMEKPSLSFTSGGSFSSRDGGYNISSSSFANIQDTIVPSDYFCSSFSVNFMAKNPFSVNGIKVPIVPQTFLTLSLPNHDGEPMIEYHYLGAGSSQSGNSNVTFISGQPVETTITATSAFSLDAITSMTAGAGSFEVRDDQNNVLHYEAVLSDSLVKLSQRINLDVGDSIKIIEIPSVSQNRIIHSTTSHPLYAYSSLVINGVPNTNRLIYNFHKIDWYTLQLQLQFSNFAFGNELDYSLIAGKTIEVSKIKPEHFSATIDMNSPVTNEVGNPINKANYHFSYQSFPTPLDASYVFPENITAPNFTFPLTAPMMGASIFIQIRSENYFTIDPNNIKLPILE